MQLRSHCLHLLSPGSSLSNGFDAFVATMDFSWVVILAITEALVFAEVIKMRTYRKHGLGKLRN